MIHRHPILFSFLFIGFVVSFFIILFLYILGRGEAGIFFSGDIAVVKIEGEIFDSGKILEELEKYRKSNSIKAIVLRINSPGGGVAPSQEIFEEIKKLKKTKKIVVSMGWIAASGGYYIASAADKIIASPGTITGSIGVIFETFGFQELVKLAHVERRILKSGEYKDVGSPFREMTETERVYLQNLIDNMYKQFKVAVAQERKMPLEKIDLLAQGKVYTGEQALENGLIDAMGTLYDAIDEAKKLANLPENARVVWPHENLSPLDLFSSKLKTWLGLPLTLGTPFHTPLWLYKS